MKDTQTIKAVLNKEQLKTTESVGRRRVEYAINHGLRKTRGGLDPHERGAAERHILGAASEYAVAWKTNLFWHEHIGDIDARDVGDLIEVRYVNDWERRLILHEDSADDAPFVLVVAEPPVFTLRGWIMASDGKRKDWWQDPTRNGRHAFFVPTNQLRPMVEIFWVIEDFRTARLNATVPPRAAAGTEWFS